MPDIDNLVAALIQSEKEDKLKKFYAQDQLPGNQINQQGNDRPFFGNAQNDVSMQLQGSGGYDNSRGSSLVTGGLNASMNIPVSDRTIISPYIGGGGAYGKVQTPQGDIKISKFVPQFGGHIRYRFD